MPVLLQLNGGIVGSTGTIMLEIDRYAQETGMKTYIASVNNRSSAKDYPANHFKIGSILEKHIHRKLAFLTGEEGGYSYFATKRFLKIVDTIKPDIIQLHNLHWNYINLKLLFDYLKKHTEIKVVWTLHDCWSYTGHCPYYDIVNCNRWKTGCYDCPSYKEYPPSLIDNSKKMYSKKRNLFLGVTNMTLVTPSSWLNGEIEKSFLHTYPRKIIRNGIDTKIFFRKKSNFREQYNIVNKFVILGCAYSWSIRKGFDCFLELSQKLDEKFVIVLVGGFSSEQILKCDDNKIIHIPSITSKEKLAEIYSACDVFFNPTREEMFGLVNIEAEACGTPVITFDSGGSPECIEKDTGFVIPKNDVLAAYEKILWLYENSERIDRDAIRRWACKFESSQCYKEYIRLYEELIGESREE